MPSKRQLLEDEIIRRLIRNHGSPNGQYLKAVEPYNGEIDQTEGPDDFFRAYRGRSPFVLVAGGSGSYDSESVGKNRYKRVVQVELIVGSNHMRTRENRLRKDVAAKSDPSVDPGIYQIIEDIFDSIAGECFGLEGTGRLTPVREDVLLQEQAFTAWRLTYRADLDAIGSKHDAGSQALDSYEIDGNLVDTDGETVLPSPPNPFTESDGTL